ncbi:MAG: flagellar motor switch protein FliG [Thermodesulfobacteriota bacterium]|nr:flagellar motor switch protein FliG [Thermodesulfobacteriota bacterium]
MAIERLSGPQKAAILLFSLGEEIASTIVKQLDEEEIKKIGGSISKLSSLSTKVVETILSEFQEASSSQLPIQIGHEGGSQFIKSIVSRAINGEKAQNLLEEIQEEGKWNLFQKIRRLDPKTVSNFLRAEHPQTIAIILTHLDSSQASAILEELSPTLQTEVICRIAELENIPPGIVEEIDQVLQEEIATIKGFEGQKRGGVRLAAEILNQMEGSAEGNILKEIEEQKQGLAEEIRKLMFIFEDLLQVDDRSIMAILKEINNETLTMALKTASEELREKVFKNMSERAAQMLKEDLEVMGPARLKDVETAQQSILKVAKKLESEGKIVLVGKGKEEVFV